MPGAVAHSPCGEARAGTRTDGWSGAVAHSPRGEARRRGRPPKGVCRRGVHAPLREARRWTTLEGSPTRVHAPLREARRWDYLRGRPSAGARSLAGGAEHAFLGTLSGEHMFATVTINPLDKACQVSLARKIGWRGALERGSTPSSPATARRPTASTRHAPIPRGQRRRVPSPREPCLQPSTASTSTTAWRSTACGALRSGGPWGSYCPTPLGLGDRTRRWCSRRRRNRRQRGGGGRSQSSSGGRRAPTRDAPTGGSAGGACLASGSLGHSHKIAPGAGAPPFAPPD